MGQFYAGILLFRGSDEFARTPVGVCAARTAILLPSLLTARHYPHPSHVQRGSSRPSASVYDARRPYLHGVVRAVALLVVLVKVNVGLLDEAEGGVLEEVWPELVASELGRQLAGGDEGAAENL